MHKHSGSEGIQQDDAFDDPEEDDLPTYENLAQTEGPNSRFGRWRGWVEKRAAERYLDDDPEERSRRRAKGWGEPVSQPEITGPSSISINGVQNSAGSNASLPPAYSNPHSQPVNGHVGQTLEPSHIALYNFGSRFLPHSKLPIRSLLPIMQDRFLLMGTQEGLAMLDTSPCSNSESSCTEKGPEEAVQRELWHGEGVYQLALLESSGIAGDIPQGVVMALVGTDFSDSTNDKEKEKETFRTVRMYNLSSLASLATWVATQKQPQPLDLHTSSRGNPHTYSRRHKHHASITKSLKTFVADSALSNDSRNGMHQPPSSNGIFSISPLRSESGDSSDSQWDVVEDLPLRWATDFVPLASAGSKLSGISVNFFEIWRNDIHGGSGSVILAIATKNLVLLYETPRGERAFKFMKEFYTPLPARKLCFVYQKGPDTTCAEGPSFRRISFPEPLDGGNKLCMFILFEKKAGIIRLSDSAVCEVELYGDRQSIKATISPTTSPFRRSIAGFDTFGGPAKEARATWILPSHISLPSLSVHSSSLSTFNAIILSRGRQSHILPSPLPNPISSVRPLKIISWEAQPSRVLPRLCWLSSGEPYLQLVGIGEEGVEVQEIPLLSICGSIGKGKAPVQSPIHATLEIGFDAGFLCTGGSWNESSRSVIPRDLVTPHITSERCQEHIDRSPGIYFWSCKDQQDWRICWLGGPKTPVTTD